MQARLGEGAGGTVYRADGPRGMVAVKLLGAGLGETGAARFRREVASLARVQHPNVIPLVDHGLDPTWGPYLVMPLLSGVPLRQLGQKLSPEVTLVLLEALAGGLAAIHAEGLVHRDVKPDNVMLTSDGRLVLIDLGLALDPAGSRHTQEGAVAGSVPYMAPEQVEGGPLSPAADVWAMGVIAYELVAGRRPFERDRQREEVAAILAGDYPPLSSIDRRVSPAFEEMVASFLRGDAGRRPRDAAAAWQAIAAQIDWVDHGSLPAELAAIVRSPSAYEASLTHAVALSARARAETLLAGGDPFAAMREIDRGLAYAPDDAGLNGLVERAVSAGPPAVAAAPAPPPKRRAKWPWVGAGLLAAAGIAAAVLLARGGADEGAAVDWADPRSVTEAVFEAAQTGDASLLPELCDPQGENDRDTQNICEARPGTDTWSSFRMTFENARVLGARVGLERAKVEFAFGVAGSRTETMNLVKRGDRWYLASF